MNPHTTPLPPAQEPGRLTHGSHRRIVSWALPVFLGFLLSGPAGHAETYTSSNSHYPTTFYNWDGHQHNDAHYSDAVCFAGKELYFFTLISSIVPATPADDPDRYLYFYAYDGACTDKLDIANSSTLDFRIKLVATSELLYVFYTPAASTDGFDTGTLYYRTASVDHGTSGKEWRLAFSDQKSVTARVSPATLRMAHIMDDTLYVLYSSGEVWHSISASDGVHTGSPRFGAPITLFTANGTVRGAGGAVFQIPNTVDTNDVSLDRLMIGYATWENLENTLTFYVFDGATCHSVQGLKLPTGASPASVRLIAGSAQGYNNALYSMQVFFTHDQDSTWHCFYHAEYIPAGDNGCAGTWSASWTRLSASDDDAVHCYPSHESDSGWAALPVFASASTNTSDTVQSYLRLWYARETHLHNRDDTVNTRCSSYLSDVLVHQPTIITGTEMQDLGSSMVLGVIEGTPPYPLNEGILTNSPVPHYYSSVDMAAVHESSFETAWSVGGGVMVYASKKVTGKDTQTGKVEDKGDWKVKWSSAVTFTKSTETSGSYASSKEFKNFDLTPPGDLGWLVVLKPEIVNDPYLLRAYDQHPLAFSGDTSGNEVVVSLITYGPGTSLDYVSYYLTAPGTQYGTNAPAPHLEGMAARPSDTDFRGWMGLADYYRYTTGVWTPVTLQTTNSTGALTTMKIEGSPGTSTHYTYIYSTTVAGTAGGDENFSLSGKNVGLAWTGGAGVSFNLSLESTTTTTLTGELGFQYEVPACCNPPPCDYECISDVTVYPVLLVPIDDEAGSGYAASWISDDIRNNKKPMPWCLTYWTYLSEMNGKLELLPAGGTSGGPLRLILTGTAGATYDLEASADLDHWWRFSSVTLSDGNNAEVSVSPATSGPHQFYRAKRL